MVCCVARRSFAASTHNTPTPFRRRHWSPPLPEKTPNVVKLTLRDRESAQEAVRRFRKLVERSGIKKEMRIREFYEKPSATKRRAKIVEAL